MKQIEKNKENNENESKSKEEKEELKIIKLNEENEIKETLSEDKQRMIILNNLKYIIQYYKNRNYHLSILTSKRYDYLFNLIKEDKIMKNVDIIEINHMIKQQFFVELTHEKKAVLLSNREIDKLNNVNDRKWMKDHQVTFELQNNTFIPDTSFTYPIDEE